MIVNSVKSILAGFGATSMRGVSASQVGLPGQQQIIHVTLPGQGINVGYVKCRISQMAPATASWNAMVFSASRNDNPPIVIIGTENQPFSSPIVDPNWEGSIVRPFVLDYNFNFFVAAIQFTAGITYADIDFEVWGNAMAGGQ